MVKSTYLAVAADFLFPQPPLVLLAPVTKGWVDQSIFKCKSIAQHYWETHSEPAGVSLAFEVGLRCLDVITANG